jgi:hypothetical protein
VRNLDVASLPSIDCVWASPVCTQYSIARTTGGPRNLEAADELVLAALSIVAALGDDVPFFMENPYTGLLKTRPFMQELSPPKLVDYCKYGFAYRKRTAIWTNIAWEPSQPLCRHDCSASVGKRHEEKAQRGTAPHYPSSHSVNQLYSIPHTLCQEIAAFMTSQMSAPTS